MRDLERDALAASAGLRAQFATETLPLSLAKVFGQHVRLRAGRDQLPSWQRNEFDDAFAHAVRLIEIGVADVQESYAEGSHTNPTLRRAAEILEWLNHNQINDDGLPLGILSAACYQIAGYPARARTLALQRSPDEQDAPLIRTLVGGDFARLLARATRTAIRGRESATESPDTIHVALSSELASAVGVIALYLRTGESDRLELAFRKLDDVSSGLGTAPDLVDT